ncbi:MAG: phospholipid/cholesterol/gamma-HCH transport system substrate-binding protein [Mycobacterium sp.]|jgi:phospholipid/cholesterol/gamma-HCH transport system substrate-binding protein|nr:phospholipid/cholesterol/gamma-HCH transport system substrate-binding protein [Mycobacterium sp.]
MTSTHRSELQRQSPRALSAVFALILAAGTYLVWPVPASHTVIGHFSSTVGLYSGDDVKVAGIPVGRIEAIAPGPTDTKVTMTVAHGVELPADASAIIVAPNLVSARFVEFTPAYKGGATLPDGATIAADRTAVPVEWDDVKDELTKLSAQLGPQPGSLQGPLSSFVNQAADTFDGNGDSFRTALRELSQTAGRLSDSRTDLLGTVKNLHILIDALSASNEQMVAFSNHVASVTQVLADSSTDLDASLTTLNTALSDVRGFLEDNNTALIGQVNKLADFTKILTDHSDDIEQVLHVAPNGLANFYNMYSPAQGSIAGLVSIPEFANPVQFICGGVFEAAAGPDNYKRAEVCRERMAPVLRRFTANYPPFLFHPINSITAYKGQIIYDTPATEAKAQTPVPNLQWQPAPGVTAPAIPPGTDLSSIMLPPATDPPGPAPAGTPGNLPAPEPPPATPVRPVPPLPTDSGAGPPTTGSGQ